VSSVTLVQTAIWQVVIRVSITLFFMEVGLPDLTPRRGNLGRVERAFCLLPNYFGHLFPNFRAKFFGQFENMLFLLRALSYLSRIQKQ